MPAAPALLSSRTNALDTLFSKPRRLFSEGVANRLEVWIDTVAPEGYEDETGFHLLPVRTTGSRAPVGELNYLGEHI